MNESQIIVAADRPTGVNDGSAGKGVKGYSGRQRRLSGPVLPVQAHMDIRRNQPCPCKSGKKAKKCCLPRLKMLAALPPLVRTEAICAGILGHWPTVEPQAPVPAAVQNRFNELAAANGAVVLGAQEVTPIVEDTFTPVEPPCDTSPSGFQS